jgi:hypothetical protein
MLFGGQRTSTPRPTKGTSQMTLVPSSISTLPAVGTSKKPTTGPNVWHGFYRTVRLTASIQVACLQFATFLSTSSSRKRSSHHDQHRWFTLISGPMPSFAQLVGNSVHNLMIVQKAELEAQTELNIGVANLASLGLRNAQQKSANAEEQLVELIELIELVNVINIRNASAHRSFAQRWLNKRKPRFTDDRPR